MEMKLIRPFGPSILKVEIPKKIITELNNYVDQIVKDSEKQNNLNQINLTQLISNLI